MNEYKLAEALGSMPDDLLQEATQIRKKPVKDRILRLIAIAAAVAILLTVFSFWSGHWESEKPATVVAPGVLKVYACDVEKMGTEEYKKFELKDGVGGYGSYIPYSSLTKNIPLYFEFPEDFYKDTKITFEISLDYGYFLKNHQVLREEITAENGETLFWECSMLKNPGEVVDKNGRFYGYVIIYADDSIVGYGVIDFFFYDGENAPQVFSAIGFSTVCYPMVDGEYQVISEEYIWKQIEEYKKVKSEDKVVLPMDW